MLTFETLEPVDPLFTTERYVIYKAFNTKDWHIYDNVTNTNEGHVFDTFEEAEDFVNKNLLNDNNKITLKELEDYGLGLVRLYEIDPEAAKTIADKYTNEDLTLINETVKINEKIVKDLFYFADSPVSYATEDIVYSYAYDESTDTEIERWFVNGKIYTK